jgi:hypothetical protein
VRTHDQCSIPGPLPDEGAALPDGGGAFDPNDEILGFPRADQAKLTLKILDVTELVILARALR